MEIKCLFYAEFDVTTGPELLHQLPLDYIDADKFKAFSSLIIPDKVLCGKLNIIQLSPSECLMGLPTAIVDHEQYERGSFQFNFGLVIGQSDFNRLHKRLMAEQIVRKMAYYLTSMEC
jgi:hypothetical protein